MNAGLLGSGNQQLPLSSAARDHRDLRSRPDWAYREGDVYGERAGAKVAALMSLDVPLERIVLEACWLTAWLHDELRAAGRGAFALHR